MDPRPAVTDDLILELDGSTVLRVQEEQVLVYHQRSDELYLLPPSACYALRLFNGLRTVGEVEGLLCAVADVSPEQLRSFLRGFVSGMVERGVLVEATAGSFRPVPRPPDSPSDRRPTEPGDNGEEIGHGH